MNLLMSVFTRDGTCYRVCQLGLSGRVTLVFGEGESGRREFPTMRQALFCLGGMVDWLAWTDESRARLAALNNGQSI